MHSIKEFMSKHGIHGEFLTFEQSCHTAQEAADASGAQIDEIVKNVCMIGSEGNLIVCIIPATKRADLKKISALGSKVRLAKSEEVKAKSGFEVGAVPSFGYFATFYLDKRLMEKPNIYTSGGTFNTLVKINPHEILKHNSGEIAELT